MPSLLTLSSLILYRLLIFPRPYFQYCVAFPRHGLYPKMLCGLFHPCFVMSLLLLNTTCFFSALVRSSARTARLVVSLECDCHFIVFKIENYLETIRTSSIWKPTSLYLIYGQLRNLLLLSQRLWRLYCYV